ncbi:MAG TPA: DUF3887 domain-containing protein, partial [Thermoanaerobaculia bacterium]|nr:DUF3887 domain-containing protein [Thermoanaerobaculia bacterium]
SAQTPTAKPEPSPAKDPVTIATTFVDHLAKGDFQAGAQGFTDQMKQAAPPESLQKAWTSMQGQFGAFKRRGSTRTEGPLTYLFGTAEFERGTQGVRVIFDPAGRVAGFFISSTAAPEGVPGQTIPPQHVAAAEKLLNQVAKGDLAAATGSFNEEMKKAISAEQLAATWKSVEARHGAYKRLAVTRVEPPLTYVFVTVDFEKGPRDLRVVVDGAGRIAGFTIVQPPKAAAPPPQGR